MLQATQTELNKAAEDFRALHAERQELLAQWEGVLEAIAKRDAAILEAGNAFASKKAALAQLKAQLDAQAAVLDGEAGAGGAGMVGYCRREEEGRGTGGKR